MKPALTFLAWLAVAAFIVIVTEKALEAFMVGPP
jgi:hypothetical protein